MSELPERTDAEGRGKLRRRLFLLAASLQLGCGLIFVNDLRSEWAALDPHILSEIAGILALAFGAALSLHEYRRLLRRNARIERALDTAVGGFQQSIERHFAEWDLTRAERDVALLTIKGLGIPEIARLRNTAVGTVKAQNAAIYRKAGVSGRAELISALIEELIAGIDISGQTPEVVRGDDSPLRAGAKRG